MRKLLSISFAIFISVPLLAQKYRDIHPSLAKATDEEALSILKSYIIEDLDHPNANLRLALIYEKRFLSSDPITEYERAMANAEEAKLRFTKAAAVVDEKEVSKNEGYYVEFASGFDSKGRPIIDYNTVNQKIRNGFDSADVFIKKMPEIYSYFTKSVNFHDKAVKIFNEINGNYSSRDKLLLLHDSNLQYKLEDLIADYDSSIVNLDKYLAAGKAFDPAHFNQSYIVKDIETYRLQGLLASPNFLVKNIEIWNYKKWAQAAINEVNNEITSLRTQLNAAELALSNKLKTMTPLVSVPDFKPYQLDNKLLFNLVKYDNQSLPVSLLKYKQHKQDLINQLGKVNDRDTTGSNDIFLVNLGDLIYSSREADSLLNIAKSRVNEENIEKYESYFKVNYSGQAGVNDFINKDEKLISDSKNQAVNQMLSTLNKMESASGKNAFITYRKNQYSLSPKRYSILDSLNNVPVTVATQDNADGSKYLTGVLKKKPDESVVFVLKADASNKVQWYNEYNYATAGPAINEVGGMAITPEGCAILVRSFSSEGITNTLSYIGEKGNEIFKKAIELSDYPRSIKYIESTNAFLMTYKGVSRPQNPAEKESTQMMSVNILGDILWTHNFDFSGTIEDVITVDKGFLIVGNYSEIKDADGKSYRTKINVGQTNAFVARFTNSGKLASLKAIESPNNYVVKKVIKVNDRIINLLGTSGTLEYPESKRVHIIVNNGPEILHTNL